MFPWYLSKKQQNWSFFIELTLWCQIWPCFYGIWSKSLKLLFLVLNCQLGVKTKKVTIQTSLISVYNTHCNQLDMLGLGVNLSVLLQIHLLAMCFCIGEFVYRNWCWCHESGSRHHLWCHNGEDVIEHISGELPIKVTGERTRCIIFILFHLGRQKTEILLQKVVISWHLVQHR